jgi:predicted nuclease of predicted toxin-antitoxin system
MKFIVDAQLPRQLCEFLCAEGYEAIHTLDLMNGNRTSDKEINALSLAEQRIVITKDADFVDSFLLSKCPYKSLLISTGNISNKELKDIMNKNLPTIVAALTDYHYVELTRNSLIEHG